MKTIEIIVENCEDCPFNYADGSECKCSLDKDERVTHNDFTNPVFKINLKDKKEWCPLNTNVISIKIKNP